MNPKMSTFFVPIAGLALTVSVAVITAGQFGDSSDSKLSQISASSPVSTTMVSFEETDEKEGAKFFTENILPVLKDSCISCHGEDEQESGLRLDSRDAVLKGGDRGEIIDKEDPDSSLLLSALKFREECELQMPPDGKLDDEVIEAFKKWIEMGLPWSE